MGHRAWAVSLVCGLAISLAPPVTATPLVSPVSAAAVASAPSAVAAKKKAKGTLRVAVSGTGSYTVTGNGFRKTGQVSKRFQVAPGAYKVQAPGATVSPGKVKVRAGKTATIQVSFPPPVTPAPSQSPVTPPVEPPPPPTPPTTTPPPPADTTPPGPVTGLTAGTRTDSSIGLSWSNPADADLAAVIVRRAQGSVPPGTPGAGTAVTLPTPTATSVTDSGLTADTDYSYAVFTRDSTGNTTTTPVTVASRTRPTPDTTPPPVPSRLTAQAGNAQARLAWDAVTAPDLKEYVVYRATDQAGPWTEVTGSPLPGTTLTVTGLTNATTYWFTVASRDTTGNTSNKSTAVSATPIAPDTTPPGPVTSLTVGTRTDTSIGLSWTNPGDADLAAVIVRRAQGKIGRASCRERV